MRKQFKKIMSVVLSAAMVLSLGTGMNQKTANADDGTAATDTVGAASPGGAETPEKEGVTAMLGFQTNHWDFRNANLDADEWTLGPKYLEWLAENDDGFDLAAYRSGNPSGCDVYYNGSGPSLDKKTGELKEPEKVEMDQDAVVTDVQMTKDGEYTVRIDNIDLTGLNPNIKDAEIFNMLYIVADTPYSENIVVTASSIKLDDVELLQKEAVLPQKSDKLKPSNSVMAMVADAYNPAKYTDLLYGKGDDALTTLPAKRMEITFNISGVSWDGTGEPQPTEEASEEPAPTIGGTIDIVDLAKPFDIGIAAVNNAALTSGDITASVFGTADYWEKLKSLGNYSEADQKFYNTDEDEEQIGSINIAKTGMYELKVKALSDNSDDPEFKGDDVSVDLVGDKNGAIYLPVYPNQMPEGCYVIGDTITVNDKEYAWGARMYADSSDDVRLPVVNEWASGDEAAKGNPIAEEILVKKGDLITFKFAVITGEAPAEPTAVPTATPTAPPASNSYNAYLAFQTDNWIFRDEWNKEDTGLKSKDYDYKKQIAVSGKKTKAVDVTIKDAEIKDGVTNYTISITGANLKTLKSDDAGAKLATQFNMLFISTDIPLTQKNVKCTNATLKLDGKVQKTYKTVPCKGDVTEYYQLMLADAYAPGDGTANADDIYPKGKTLKNLPTNSIEVSFSISGVDFDKSTAGPAKDKTFTNGDFKYKVTKESQISASTKKVTVGKVALVGLSNKGKKAKKLTVKDTLKQGKGKFKVVKMAAGAMKKAKAANITLGKNIKALPANAFKNCKKLKKLTLKAKLSSVNKKAFNGCTKKITIAGTAKKQNVKKIKKVYKKVK